jgi:hypothetical protein
MSIEEDVFPGRKNSLDLGALGSSRLIISSSETAFFSFLAMLLLVHQIPGTILKT